MLGSVTLSFAEHLRHAFTPITNRMKEGVHILNEVISFYEARIQAERDFVKALDRLCQRPLPSTEIGTLAAALTSIKTDLANELTSRTEFVNSLEEEVYQPLVKFRDAQEHLNDQVVLETTQKVKHLRRERAKYTKVKNRYDKVFKDCQAAESAMVSAQNATQHQVLKTRRNTPISLMDVLHRSRSSADMSTEESVSRSEELSTNSLENEESFNSSITESITSITLSPIPASPIPHTRSNSNSWSILPLQPNVKKLGSRVNTTRRIYEEFKPKYDTARALWNQEQHTFYEEMTTILSSMQEQEEKRLRCLCDCCLKTAVFITNFNENRRYDIIEITNNIQLTNPEGDLQTVIKQLLKENPASHSDPLNPLRNGRKVNPIDELYDVLSSCRMTLGLPRKVIGVLIAYVGFIEQRLPFALPECFREIVLSNQKNESVIVFASPLQQHVERQWFLKFVSMPVLDADFFLAEQFVVQICDFGEVYHISTQMDDLPTLYVSSQRPKYDEETRCMTWDMHYALIPGRAYLLSLEQRERAQGDISPRPLEYEAVIPIPNGPLDPDDRVFIHTQKYVLSVDLSYSSQTSPQFYGTFNQKRYALGFSTSSP